MVTTYCVAEISHTWVHGSEYLFEAALLDSSRTNAVLIGCDEAELAKAAGIH